MNNYKKYNLALGWLAFLITAIVYIMTTEPSASLWDCSEFIATSYKLEVGHPPGAPLFMMISRIFAIFAPGKEYAALAINIMSCLASAFTIAFLFWTITHLAKKFFKKAENELSTGEIWAIMASGFIGSLAYAFTDSFWFSGVEAEVYALSSLFTAMVFWAMFKWEDVADQPHANRWLILIAYLMGLSIGVHLLNLLAFPAMVFIYYFKKYPEATKKGALLATAIAFLIVVFVLYVVVPGTVAFGAAIDRLFVNSFGLPINSGMLVYALLLFGALGYGIYATHKKGRVILNTIMVMVTVIILGYSSYASVIIRSAVNPPMNSNDPSNPYGLQRLLSRDQYGDRPLVRGAYYNSPAIAYKYGTSYYVDDNGKYKSLKSITGVEYDPNFIFFFPRMHKSQPESDIEAYKSWGQVEGRPMKYGDETIMVPTFGENLRFFFSYQLNFMYWRYFMWNFVGRQSDIQSTGEITNGNWMSGIKAIDELYLGPQDNIPSELANNKGRNLYYFLPMLLGVLGLVYQLSRDKKNFTVVMWLFFMTGIAIVLYLNQGPAEPRERDYAYSGSFYAFAIWIGLGVLWLYEVLEKAIKKPAVAAITAAVVCSSVPLILIAQNWDDHDRSHRYVARDMGYDYLESTLPNSIIMNYGDNDTFPLWYNQEVEDVRPDVRIMNMSYLGAEWYIDQMRQKYNESEAVPFSLPRSKYIGVNERIGIQPLFTETVTAKQVIEWIKSDDPRTKGSMGDTPVDYIPTKRIALPVNKQNAVASGIIRADEVDLAEDTIFMNITKSSLDRGEMMLVDLLANFDWKRPLFFTSSASVMSLGLPDYLQFDGFAYRLTPIKTPYKSFLNAGRVDTDVLYDKLMNKFKYGNVKDPRVYVDYFVQNTLNSTQARGAFGRLAQELALKGEKAKAIEVLNRGIEEMPFSQVPYSYMSTLPVIEGYYMAGDSTAANKILSDYTVILKEYVDYYLRFPESKRELVYVSLRQNATILFDLYAMAKKYNQKEVADAMEKYLTGVGIM